MSKNVGVYFQKQTSSVCCVVKVGEKESASCRRPVVTTQVSFSKNQVLRAARRLTNLEANAMICLSAFALKKISNGHDEQDVPEKKAVIGLQKVPSKSQAVENENTI